MPLNYFFLGCCLLCCVHNVCCTQYSVYKDVGVSIDGNTNVISSKVEGASKRLVDLMSPGDGVRLAFATGECGQENWSGYSGDVIANANIGLLNDAQIPYTISTGGADGVFTCSSRSGADTFLNRYMGQYLQGLDFDIESDFTAADSDWISDLMNNILYLQQNHPELIMSFTLATIASTGDDHTSVNALGESVLKAAQAVGLKYVVNLMAMSYGPTPSQWICVQSGDTCDMGASAIQAANNFNTKYRVPFTEIALTLMIGINGDTGTEISTFQDMQGVLDFSSNVGLAGVHYWSFDRDCQCLSPAGAPSPTCSGVQQSPLQYYNMLMHRNVKRDNIKTEF